MQVQSADVADLSKGCPYLVLSCPKSEAVLKFQDLSRVDLQMTLMYHGN